MGFYEERTKHRKLTWIYALGVLTVKGNFAAKPVEMHISPFQASCLLLFNREDTLSYNDIVQRLNLPDEDVRRTLHSLACSKYKILKKSPEGRTIADTDSFSYNGAFTDRAHYGKPQEPGAPEARAGGCAAAQQGVQAGFQNHQEAHRGPRRARVPRARQGRPERVQLPRVDAKQNAADACRREGTSSWTVCGSSGGVCHFTRRDDR